MSRVAWDGRRFAPHAAARVPSEDRAFVFSDAVYEVALVWRGRLVDGPAHIERLARSLAGLEIPPPMPPAALSLGIAELIRRNGVRHGSVYLQVSRGAAERGHAFPRPAPRAGVFASARHGPAPAADPGPGEAVALRPDLRWARCEYKTTSLLANCLAQESAEREGAATAWLTAPEGALPGEGAPPGAVREGAHSNAWIVDAEGRLRTHPVSPRILAGTTRAAVLALARSLQIPVEERAFSTAELAGAREAFNTDTTGLVSPVVSIDGRPVGDGRPGPVAARLRAAYLERLEGGAALSEGLLADGAPAPSWEALRAAAAPPGDPML